MLDRVLSYVRSVLAGEVQGDPAVGRYLLDTFAASTDDLEKGGFNASLQVNRLHAVFHLNVTYKPRGIGYSNGFVFSKPRAVPG